MANQQSGGNKKRPRRPRAAHKVLAAGIRKEKRIKRHKLNLKLNRKSRKYGFKLDFGTPEDKVHPATFDNMYSTFRKTRGRQGLQPDPDERQDENLWVTHPFWCGRFPITELMEKPIQYSSPHKIGRYGNNAKLRSI